MDPPIATVELNFFPAGCVSVVLVRKLVHLDDHLFGATDFNHRLSEGLVADEPVVDAVVFLVTTFLLQVDAPYGILCIPVSFSIPVTTWSVLSDVETFGMENVSKMPEIYRFDSRPNLLSSNVHIRQYITPALQWLRQNLHCHFGSALTISEISMFPASMITIFDSSLNCIE